VFARWVAVSGLIPEGDCVEALLGFEFEVLAGFAVLSGRLVVVIGWFLWLRLVSREGLVCFARGLGWKSAAMVHGLRIRGKTVSGVIIWSSGPWLFISYLFSLDEGQSGAQTGTEYDARRVENHGLY
jgi:hypothetical protein